MTPESLVRVAIEKAVRRRGGLVRKITYQGRCGAPDLLIMVNERAAFVELKTRGGRISPIQRVELNALKYAGAIPVFVAFGAEEAVDIIDAMCSVEKDWCDFISRKQWGGKS